MSILTLKDRPLGRKVAESSAVDLESVLLHVLGVGMEVFGGLAGFCYEGQGLDQALQLRAELDIGGKAPRRIEPLSSLPGNGHVQLVPHFFARFSSPADKDLQARTLWAHREAEAAVLLILTGDGKHVCLVWVVAEPNLNLKESMFSPLLATLTAYAYSSRPIALRDEIRTGFLDPLTGLATETQLIDRLHQEISLAAIQGSLLCVICFDLDRYNELTVVYGYKFAHGLMVKIAEAILASLPAGAFAARHSGDRFAIVLPGSGPGQALRLIDVIRKKVGTPVVDGISVNSTIRAGIGARKKDEPADDLLQIAEAALVLAKTRLRRKRVLLRSSAVRAMEHNPLRLEHELRESLKNGSFELHFQPIVTATDQADLYACECLLRWQRANGRTVGPAVFVPVAESTGLMTELGAWVIRAACRAARHWLDKGLVARLSVNVSPRQLEDANLAGFILQNLAALGLPRSTLIIEITESTLLDLASNARALGNLKRLHEAGVRIALDDFGVGYSCLAYLRDYPLSVVKLDHSFARTLNTASGQTLTRSVIRLLHDLGYDVVAEGVETEEQRQIMQDFGADYFQGYLFARPLRCDWSEFFSKAS